MRKIVKYILGIMALMMLAGCVNLAGKPSTAITLLEPTNVVSATAPANAIPKLNGDWRIVLNQSGGIMGMSTSIEILSSGAVTVADQRSQKTSQGKLTADQLKTLTGLVADSNYQPNTKPSGCADCFIFNLGITSAGQKFQVEMNDIDLQNSGLQRLVGYLGNITKSIQK